MKSEANLTKGYLSVFAGFTLMFLCGVAYSYGVALPSIQESFGLTGAQAALPFSAILVSYTLGMWVGGICQDKVGPLKACLFGALLFGVGYAASSFAPNLAVLLATYGLVTGFGIGVSYIAATSNAVNWFPERKGLAAGCVILGFGMGTLVLAPLKQWLISIYGWQTTFLAMGICFTVLGVLLALLVRAPDASSIVAEDVKLRSEVQLTTREMIKTPSFRRLWLAWALALCAGLGWMAHLASMTENAGVSPSVAAWTLSAVALTNGLSRPVAGALADKFGRLSTLTTAGIVFTLISCFMLLPIEGSWRFFVMSIVFGACFGTFLVNYSPLAAEFYGTKNLGSNLGLLYTSYGVGALTGPGIFGALYDTTGTYTYSILLSVVLAIVSALLFRSAKNVPTAGREEIVAKA